MATDADAGTAQVSTPSVRTAHMPQRKTWSLGEDYRTWKMLAWCGPIFLAAFFCLWGLLGGNIPPFLPSASPLEVKQHYLDHRLAIMIGMSVCLSLTACYMAWGVAI